MEHTLRAIGSYDPNGEIVYHWDFGDGTSKTVTESSVRHRFKDSATYRISLTVIDNRGKSASTSFTLEVAKPGERAGGSPQQNGCGCGK